MDPYLQDAKGNFAITLLKTTNDLSTGMMSSSAMSRFNLYYNDGRVHVYRRNGERYADNCIVERDSSAAVASWSGAPLTIIFDRVCW